MHMVKRPIGWRENTHRSFDVRVNLRGLTMKAGLAPPGGIGTHARPDKPVTNEGLPYETIHEEHKKWPCEKKEDKWPRMTMRNITDKIWWTELQACQFDVSADGNQIRAGDLGPRQTFKIQTKTDTA